MPDHFTSRLALPYPDLDDPADVPVDLQQLAERLDLLIPAGSGAGLALNRTLVGDVGMAGQVRAGRQLALTDFTNLGLSAPRGLWNLSDLADASGNGRNLVNKGAVTFAPGINGLAATAAQLTGSAAQALYLLDTGAADPFRITTGTWGCWMRTAKRGVAQYALSKIGAAGTNAAALFALYVNASNGAVATMSDGTTAISASGLTDVCDDRWHLVVGSYDGTALRLYVDGTPEAVAPTSGLAINQTATAPLNISGFGADAGAGALSPWFGRVDEAWVTADVLTEEQVRNLYCARLPHTLGLVPSGAKLNVTRRRRGGAWAVADFPTQPLRLYNFTAGALTDQGANNAALVNAGTAPVTVAGVDGASAGALAFGATAGAHLTSATDAGLPAGLTPRSYGLWLKSTGASGTGVVLSWGTLSTGDIRVFVFNGAITCYNAGDGLGGPFVADGQWHHVVVVEDNAAADGLKRKVYLDGRIVAHSVVMIAVVLAGANRFRIGANQDGSAPFTGQLDGVFVTDVALTTAQVLALWAKGAQALAPSPKNVGDHVEAWDAQAVLATFDTLDSHWQVDLGVAA